MIDQATLMKLSGSHTKEGIKVGKDVGERGTKMRLGNGRKKINKNSII